jgi:hypothetical protein
LLLPGRLLRTTLYRELAFNYDVLRRAFGAVDFEGLLEQPGNLAKSGVLMSPYLRDLHTRDYRRSLDDIETFNRLPEYHLFDMLYADFQATIDALQSADHAAIFSRAYAVRGHLEFAVLQKQLDVRRLQDYPRSEIRDSVRNGITSAKDAHNRQVQAGRKAPLPD